MSKKAKNRLLAAVVYDQLIDHHLGFKSEKWRPPRYSPRSAMNKIATDASWPGTEALHSVLKSGYDALSWFWKDQRGSPENWRFSQRRNCRRDAPNEVILERRVVALNDHWANQVPCASGALGSGDRSLHVDLVRRHIRSEEYTFVELKVASDTPLFAAVELTKYGLLYLIGRSRAADIDPTKELPKAKTIHLRVIAPKCYYIDRNRLFANFEASLDESWRSFSAEHGISVDFGFRSFPDGDYGRFRKYEREGMTPKAAACAEALLEEALGGRSPYRAGA